MLSVRSKRWTALLSIASVVILAVSACGAAPTATPAPTAVPIVAPAPTDMPAPTATTVPTAVPAPTATTVPTAVPAPAANPAPAPAAIPVLSVAHGTTLGDFLADAKGMTLYIYKNDTAGTSTCYDACAKNWPPLLTADDSVPAAPDGATGKFGFVDRTDGTYQVTYNNQPLYYFITDKAAGDTTGQGKGNVWFVASVGAPSGGATIPSLSVMHNSTLGDILADIKGMTLYTYTPDTAGASTCYSGCAKAWPPLLTSANGVPAAPAGATSKFGVTQRTDGTYQVTYNNMPLYYFANDKAAGDATGQGKGNVWFVITIAASSGAGDNVPGLAVMNNATLGNLLTDAKGMTLYIYTPDTAGASTCYNGCAKAWPPLLTSENGVPMAPAGATSKFGVTQRTDGTFQVTYNNMPLYYYVNDKAAGDATGQAKGNVWYVITIGADTKPTPANDNSGYGG